MAVSASRLGLYEQTQHVETAVSSTNPREDLAAGFIRMKASHIERKHEKITPATMGRLPSPVSWTFSNNEVVPLSWHRPGLETGEC